MPLDASKLTDEELSVINFAFKRIRSDDEDDLFEDEKLAFTDLHRHVNVEACKRTYVDPSCAEAQKAIDKIKSKGGEVILITKKSNIKTK